jgi:hypothetical protein
VGDGASATTFTLSIVSRRHVARTGSERNTVARIERLVKGGSGRLGRYVFEITVVPAVTAEEGLRVAKPMCDAPATASFTEVPRRGVLGSSTLFAVLLPSSHTLRCERGSKEMPFCVA